MSVIDRVIAVAGDLLVVFLLLISVLVVLRVVWLGIRVGRRRQLVVTALTNLTGFSALDADAAGITQAIRDTLLVELRSVHERARFLLRRAKIEPGEGELAPPRSEIDLSLRELAASVTAIASDRTRPIIQVLSDMILRPAGTRIQGSLLRYGEHNRLGIGFEIVDLRSELPPATFSLWSKKDSTSKDSVCETDAQALAAVAARAVAIELLRLDLLRRQRHRSWRGSRNPGVVSRFVGLMYQVSALSYPGYGTRMCALAVDAFRDAAAQLPDDHHPLRDLGFTYGLRHKADPDDAQQHLKAALYTYDRAEEVVERTEAGEAALLSVRISRALLRFHSRTEVELARSEARRLLDLLTTDGHTAPIWDPAAEQDEYLLYNAACLLALELGQQNNAPAVREALKTWSVQLLGYALLRDLSPDRTVFDTAENDVDLTALRENGIDVIKLVRHYRICQRALTREGLTVLDPARIREFVTAPTENVESSDV